MPLLRRALILACCTACLTPAASAQSLDTMALEWARGHFASPVVCTIGEQPVRGIRRLFIAPGRGNQAPTLNRLRFLDMEVEDASRCFDELGRPQPNLKGGLVLRYAGTAHRATAARDFRVALQRDQGFEFTISDGSLLFAAVGADGKDRVVEFKGGTARLEKVAPNSDWARVMRDLQSPRKLLLRLEAPDGTKLELPLFQTGLR